MLPEISIIVPVYKVEKYLRRCIDSILAQTFKNFELILIDDGSPDNCGKICDEYAEKDKRIVVIHKKNEGCSAARNDGLKISKGKYIGFVDSDDTIESTMYEEMYNLIEKENFDVVHCDIFTINLLENTKYIFKFKKPNYSPTVWSKLFKKELIQKYKIEFPLNAHMGEDLSFTEKYMLIGNNIGYTDSILYNYILNESSVSFNLKKRLEIYKSLDEIIKFIEINNIDDKLKFKKILLVHGYEHVLSCLRNSKEFNINLEYFIIIMYFNIFKFMKYLTLKNILYLLKIVTKAYIDKKGVRNGKNYYKSIY